MARRKRDRYKIDESRFKYLTKVYGYSILAYVVTIFQWVLFREIKPVANFLFQVPVVAVFLWFPGLIIIFVITHFNEIRTRFAVNWILFGIAVETLTFGIVFSILRGSEFVFLLLFCAVALYILLLVVIAHFLRNDLTKASIPIFALMIILFIIIMAFIIMDVLKEEVFWVKLTLCILSVILLSLIQLYASQIAQGGRYLELRTVEIILPVTITYMVLIFIFLMFYSLVEFSVMAAVS